VVEALERFCSMLSETYQPKYSDYAEHTFGFTKAGKMYKIWRFFGDNVETKTIHLFVCPDTMTIYGAASWQQPNLQCVYGTLKTVHEWDWTGTFPKSLLGKSPFVKKTKSKKKR
jgi:cytidine deaminase